MVVLATFPLAHRHSVHQDSNCGLTDIVRLQHPLLLAVLGGIGENCNSETLEEPKFPTPNLDGHH